MKDLITTTKNALQRHAEVYPLGEGCDVLKFLHQASFGCGHIVPSREAATAGILRELAGLGEGGTADGPSLSLGGFFRLSLTSLRNGLSPGTLGALLALSAEAPCDGAEGLGARLAVARKMAAEGAFGFTAEAFDGEVAAWETAGRPPVRHSEAFHRAYRPAYRVIAEEYRRLIPLLSAIDKRLSKGGRLVLAIEGGSASGKTTLASLLANIYGCTVFHMDDFFLRPEQRTPERLREPGGNVDRERFLLEVLTPLREGRPIDYRRYDCGSGRLLPPERVTPTALTVVEGAYSMHPDLADAYGLSVFLDASADCQRKRILHRNTEAHAARFFSEWIPMEHRYFEVHRPKERCTMTLTVE